MKIKNPLIKFFAFTFKCYKPYYIVAISSCLIKTLEMIYNAYSLSFLISSLEKGILNDSLIMGGIIVFINFVFFFLNKLLYRLDEVESMKLEVRVNEAISNKLMNVQFQNLEDPSFLDLKERAKMGIINFGAVSNFTYELSKIIQGLFTILGLGSIIGIFDYRLLIVLISAVIINVIIILISLKAQINFFNSLVPINRRFGYYLNTIFENAKGKDYRMYREIGDMMLFQYDKFEKSSAKEFASILKKNAIMESIQKIVSYVELASVYIIIALRVANGGLSVSVFSLYVSSAVAFTTSVVSLIDGGMEIVKTIQFILPLLELMNYKDEKDEGKKIILSEPIHSLEFKNVSFSYPKSDALIVNNISFKVSEGEKISIVGLNGAGKTTLVKLITRLYRPQQGEILINGININDYEYKSYINQISAVFQDFKIFAYSLKENILNKTDGDDKEAYDIACSVGLKNKVDSLSDGINTLYSKSYDEEGIEMSGGELQKIAIARAIYANSSLVILDEPTSALDPLAEADIYNNFNDLVKKKTAIYISHRMSSSVFCDKILVLNGGSIEGFDSHQNFIKKKDSLYYKLFMEQAKNYAK